MKRAQRSCGITRSAPADHRGHGHDGVYVRGRDADARTSQSHAGRPARIAAASRH